MSNDTQNSRDSGDNRRRRSRGGQKRRNNSNNNQDRRESDGRNSEGRQNDGGNRSGGRQSTGKPQRRPMPAPVKLTWFQKLLKSIGLYKEPVRPPRPERRPDAVEPKKAREPRRTKTRDARSDGNREGEREGKRGGHREEREQPSREAGAPRRDKRRDRGERDSNRPRGGDPSSVESRRVYVGNLSYDTTESDLEELFKGVGAVRRVEIVYNRSTHRSKGYGFIEMIDVDEAKRTVGVLHDQFFMGRQLTVSGAKSKDYEDAEDAEKSDKSDDSSNNVMPPLAPIKPEVTSLIDEPVADPTPKPEPIIEAEEEHPEVPVEEFSPEADTPEKIKDQADS